jgi:hypothetical protein
MKKRYLTFTIRQLKTKLSQLSRTTFKITRNFFQSRLGIDKRDWSRLTKAEIIRVLDYYYASLVPELAKTVLTGYRFQTTTPENLIGMLPQLPRESGQQWRLREPAKKIGELSNSDISLYYAHFQKVYPQGRQMDDNPECFIVATEIGKALYIYVSERYFNVTEFLEQIMQKYAELMSDLSSRFGLVRGDFGLFLPEI